MTTTAPSGLGFYDRIGMRTTMQGPETREGFLAFTERRGPSWRCTRSSAWTAASDRRFRCPAGADR